MWSRYQESSTRRPLQARCGRLRRWEESGSLLVGQAGGAEEEEQQDRATSGERLERGVLNQKFIKQVDFSIAAVSVSSLSNQCKQSIEKNYKAYSADQHFFSLKKRFSLRNEAFDFFLLCCLRGFHSESNPTLTDALYY